jgi:hypothetical protein
MCWHTVYILRSALLYIAGLKSLSFVLFAEAVCVLTKYTTCICICALADVVCIVVKRRAESCKKKDEVKHESYHL